MSFSSRLRTNIGLWLSLAVVAVTLAAAHFAESWSASQARERTEQKLAGLADQIALRLDRGMFERYREFELISMAPTLGDPAVPAAEKQRLLDEVKSRHAAYSWIGATDTAGKVVAAAEGLLAGADVSKRPWFVNAFNKIYVGDVHDAKLLASKLPNPTGDPIRFVDIAFPYLDPAGNVAGILGSHINWQWADQVQRSIVERGGAHATVETLIVSTDGTIILGPKNTLGSKLRVQAPASGHTASVKIESWPDGGRHLTGYSRTRGFESYPGLGWAVIVRQSADEALAPAQSLRNRVLLSGFAVAILCLVFGYAMPRRLSRA